MPDNTISQSTLDILEQDATFIDLHWNTDNEQLEEATQDLYRLLSPQNKPLAQRSDGISNLKHHLRAVLIVLIRDIQNNSAAPIACPMNRSFGKPSYIGHYDPQNPLKYNYTHIQALIKALHKYGFIKLETGRQDYFTNGYAGRASRFVRLDLINNFISNYPLMDIEFREELLNGGLIITHKNTAGYKKVIKDYSNITESRDAAHTRTWLPSYNNLINDTDIQLEDQYTAQTPIYINNKTSRRIFNDDFNHGGRFYGG